MVKTEASVAHGVPSNKELRRVSQAVESAMFDAGSMIGANDLFSTFKLAEATTESVKKQRKTLTVRIAACLISNELRELDKRSTVGRFARRVTARKGWQREKQQVLEISLDEINKQNARYLDANDKEACPQAETIKTLVDGLFEVVRERTGKPIGYPYEPINKSLLETWRKGFANTFDQLFSSQ
jgi:hypothetical protein